MLRVLHCIYDEPSNPWVGGGGAHRVFEIYRRLVGQLEATVLTGNFPGARNRRVDGIRHIRVGAAQPYVWSRWTYALGAAQMLRRSQHDVVILDFSVYTPILAPLDQRLGVVVHMLHGPSAADRWGDTVGRLLSQAERTMLRRVRWICTTSRWMLKQLEPLLDPRARVRLVGSGVSDEFRAVRRNESSYLLYYGRYDTYQKGLDVLLSAFARVATTYPQVKLWLAGRGKDADAVRRMAGELNLAERVRVWENPPREEVLSMLAGALMLVMPSRLEGLPMVPAEAMAAGVPVVATAVGGVAEVVDPPRGGLLVPPDDTVALAEAIALLLSDPARRAAISRSASVSAERFSWDHVAQEHLRFLEDIAAAAQTSHHTHSGER